MIRTFDYMYIIKKLVNIIREWNDDPKACGCDTIMCMGTCLASRSRDTVQEALDIINTSIENIGTVYYVRMIKELIIIVEEWNSDPKACECNSSICKGTCLPAKSRNVVQEALNIINVEDEI